MLRYVLTANAPETKDNDFTWADFQARNNNELVAIYGNFVNRAIVLTQKYFGGKVPAAGELTGLEQSTIAEIKTAVEEMKRLLDNFRFRDAQKEAMNIARAGNKYLADTEPWKTAKTDMQRTAVILNTALQIAANLEIAFRPFLPFSSARLRNMLNIEELDITRLGCFTLLEDGHQLGEAALLFDKIEDSAIQQQLDRLERIKQENAAREKEEELKNWHPAEVKADTSIDDFARTDIRVATVLDCQPVRKSDRLLEFRLDDGMGGRTILSGIAQSYPDPSVLIGKQVLYIANFPPRKMMGKESQGMILSAVDADGRLVVTTVSRQVRPGAQVG